MTLGSWDPQAEQAKTALTPDVATLQRYIDLSRSDKLDSLERELDDREKQVNAGLMQLDKEQWFAQVESLSDGEIEHLMRFFTCAEQLPGWEAGAHSPVIWLGKVLKQRGGGISRELQVWIKAHSNNRYLPHGPLL